MLAPLLWLAAAGMTFAVSLLIKWAATARRPIDGWYVAFLLSMMATMLAGVVAYFSAPGIGGLIEAVEVNMLGMMVALLPIFWLLVAGSPGEFDTAGPAAPLRDRRVYMLVAIPLILANEVLMGWAFQLMTGPPAASMPVWAYVAGSVSSYWFLFTMSFEMALTTYFFRREVPRGMLAAFAFQSVIMFLSPTALTADPWRGYSTALGSVAMSLFFMWLFRRLLDEEGVGARSLSYLLRLSAVYVLMMLGLYLWGTGGGVLLFSASILAEMTIYFGAILRRRDLGVGPVRPGSGMFVSCLAAANLAQLFMGAAVVVVLFGLVGSGSAEVLVSPAAFYATSLSLGVGMTLILNWLFASRVVGAGRPFLRLLARATPLTSPPVYTVAGMALFPLAVWTALDGLADSNPAYHMLQHLLIGLSGFAVAAGLVAMAKGGVLSRLYRLYARTALVGMWAAVAMLSFWFVPYFFDLALQDESIHVVEHLSIFAAGFLVGAGIRLVPRRAVSLLMASFAWMSAMMVPFVLAYGPYVYDSPDSYSYVMAPMMFSWVAAVVYVLPLRSRRRTKDGPPDDESGQDVLESGREQGT